MASKRGAATTWHKKHVPTRWGVAVLSFMLLATVILIPVLKQQQTSESDAATAINTTKQCISYNTSGKCVMYQSTTTVVNTKKPCISYNTSGQCTYYQGTTQNTTTFVPTTKPNTPEVVVKPKAPVGGTVINYGQSSACKNIGGTCQSFASNKSGGSFHAGLCPGPAGWQCWVPNTAPKVGSTTGTSYVVCHGGKLVSVGGSAASNSLSNIQQGCAQNQNMIYIQGHTYTCGTVPSQYKYLVTSICS